jgi:hypothetical protein
MRICSLLARENNVLQLTQGYSPKSLTGDRLLKTVYLCDITIQKNRKNNNIALPFKFLFPSG